MDKSLAKQNGDAMASELIPPWVAKMRQAAMDSISETDIKDIVQAQVALAKKGNANALRFVFEQVLGGAQLKGATFVQNNYAADDRPDRPSKAKPGSPDKVELMRRRVASGNGAFVDGDAGEVDGDPDLS